MWLRLNPVLNQNCIHSQRWAFSYILVLNLHQCTETRAVKELDTSEMLPSPPTSLTSTVFLGLLLTFIHLWPSSVHTWHAHSFSCFFLSLIWFLPDLWGLLLMHLGVSSACIRKSRENIRDSKRNLEIIWKLKELSNFSRIKWISYTLGLT